MKNQKNKRWFEQHPTHSKTYRRKLGQQDLLGNVPEDMREGNQKVVADLIGRAFKALDENRDAMVEEPLLVQQLKSKK